MAVNIGSTCAKDTCIDSIYAVGAWIRFTNVENASTEGIYARNASIRGVEL